MLCDFRSTSMDRRRANAAASGNADSSMHDRRPLYDRMLERNIEDNNGNNRSNGYHTMSNGVDQLHLSSSTRQRNSNNVVYQPTSRTSTMLQRSPSSTFSATDSSPDENDSGGRIHSTDITYLSSTPKSLYRSVALSMPNVPSLRSIVATNNGVDTLSNCNDDRRPTTTTFVAFVIYKKHLSTFSCNSTTLSSNQMIRSSKNSDDDESQKSSSDDGMHNGDKSISRLSKSSSSLSRSSIDDSNSANCRGLLGLANIGNTVKYIDCVLYRHFSSYF